MRFPSFHAISLIAGGLTSALFVSAGVSAYPNDPAKYEYSVVHKFKGSPDGAWPYAGLVRGADGNLYGTTHAGGKRADCKGGLGSGCGTIFRLDSSGRETVIWSFKGVPGPMYLYGSLLATKDGAFYGTTNKGGTTSWCYEGEGEGCGTAFRLNADGSLDVLYGFGAQNGLSDALQPAGDLIRCGDAEFCGTSQQGGVDNGAAGYGTVFRVSKTGKESVLYRFTDGSDGGGPGGSLVSDSDGNLYGVTGSGGGSCNCGAVFRLAPDGAYTILYTFKGGADGGTPLGGLIRDQDGNLFGTAANYGDKNCNGGSGCGVVFRLAADGTETILHTFAGPPDGELPISQLTKDSNGNLYGTTWVGGDSSCSDVGGPGCGVVFEISRDGSERVLHAFHGRDGAHPYGRVYIDQSGTLTGTTQMGGRFDLCPNGCGVIYRLSAEGS